jgi:hypothetical protein
VQLPYDRHGLHTGVGVSSAWATRHRSPAGAVACTGSLVSAPSWVPDNIAPSSRPSDGHFALGTRNGRWTASVPEDIRSHILVEICVCPYYGMPQQSTGVISLAAG